MLKNEKPRDRSSTNSNSPESVIPRDNQRRRAAESEVDDVLSERIENLNEAIEELDAALEERKALSRKFVHQINKEIEEIQYHLGQLNPPWKTGFHTQLEFFRLSLHKSLTSRKNHIRSEELKYWQDIVALLKDKRKLLDEYKSLLATKRRLDE